MKSRLVLHKDIYEKEAIENAIQDFQNIAQIKISECERYWYLDFENCVTEVQVTINEFSNYVLLETIKKVGELYD